MRTLIGAGVAVLLSTAGFAQNHGGHAGGVVHSAPAARGIAPRGYVPNTYGSTTGFGNVLFPGTGHAPNSTGNPFWSPYNTGSAGFASSLGATVGGFNSGFGNSRHRVPVGGYAYPVIVGGFGGYYPPNGYAPPPDAYPPDPYAQPAPGPQVIINQNFVPPTARPVMRDYAENGESGGIQRYEPATSGRPEASAPEDSYYLIAFKDHSIYSAFAYWVEGDTLHYVTPQRVHNQASLSRVDRELTGRLNKDRNMQVKLP